MSFRKIFVPPGQGEHSLNDISDIEFVWVVGVGWLGLGGWDGIGMSGQRCRRLPLGSRLATT